MSSIHLEKLYTSRDSSSYTDSSEIRSEQQDASNTTAITISNEDDDQIFLTKLSGIQKEYEILTNQLQDIKKLKEEDQASLIASVNEYANNIKKLDDMYKKELPIIKLNDHCHTMLDNYKTNLNIFIQKVVHLDKAGLWGHSKSVKEVKKQQEQIKVYDGVIQVWLNIEPRQFDENVQTIADYISKLFEIHKEYGMTIWTLQLEGALKLREVDRDSVRTLVDQFYDNVTKLYMSDSDEYPRMHPNNYFMTLLENYKIKLGELFLLVAEVDGIDFKHDRMGKKMLKTAQQLQGFDLIIQLLLKMELR